MDENSPLYREQLARMIRGELVQMSHRAGAAHLGSALSIVDVLVAAFWEFLKVNPHAPDDPDRDRFILSKGHAASALYATLAYRGYFPKESLATYGQVGSHFPEQPGPRCAPGVEFATGSLGHGLPVGVGMAVGCRLQRRESRVFVLLGDGECNEGSVWEAALFAPAHKLDNLIAVIDANRWQATGRSEEIMALEPLAAKWSAFGWESFEVDGHDHEALGEVLRTVEISRTGKPKAIVARTVKGKGISFMEDDNNWHYRIPSKEEVHNAFQELGLL